MGARAGLVAEQIVTRVWLLNPDAELELDHWARTGSVAFSPPGQLRKALVSRRDSFFDLTRGEPSVFFMEGLDTLAWDPTHLAIPWCPTPSLLRRARSLGLRLPETADVNVIAGANDKSQLGAWGAPCVPGRRILRTTEEAESLEGSIAWRFKRRFGFAGRAQRRLVEPWSTDDRRFVRDSLARGAIVAEPEVTGVLASIHFFVHRDETLVGAPCRFLCDRFGAFMKWSELSVPPDLGQQMSEAARLVAARLLDAGYFGPASLDFVGSSASDCYAIDLNARFSLGWSRGMGPLRERALSLFRQSP